MLARLGDRNEWHFAHKVVTPQCTDESYLHDLMKRTFYREYKTCLESGLPFEIVREEPIVCDHYHSKYGYTCQRTEVRRHDLTQYFDRVSLEKYHNSFCPDVLLQSSKTGEALFVEIAVTHPCEPEKLASGFRILEYTVRSESQIQPILDHVLYAENKHLVLHNFREPATTKSVCHGDCPERVMLFVVFPSKKSRLFEINPSIAIDEQINGRKTYVKILGKGQVNESDDYVQSLEDYEDEAQYGDDPDHAKIFRQQVREAYFQRIPIQNCYMCQYHGGGGVDSAVFCKIDKVPCQSNRAAGCAKYKPMRSLNECDEKDKDNDDYASRRW